MRPEDVAVVPFANNIILANMTRGLKVVMALFVSAALLISPLWHLLKQRSSKVVSAKCFIICLNKLCQHCFFREHFVP